MDISEISDRLEILDVYARYVHAVDKSDYETLLDRVFVAETTFDMTEGGGPVLTWEQVRQYDFFGGNGFAHFFHITSNNVIEFDADGQRATNLSKTFNPWAHGTGEDSRTFQVHGSYFDELIRTPRGWRIASRRWLNGWVGGWRDGSFAVLSTMGEMGLGEGAAQ